MKFRASVQGEPVEIELDRAGGNAVEAKIGPTPYSLEAIPVAPGIFWFNWNNRSIDVSVIRKGDAYIVSIDGRHIPVELIDARTARRRAAPGQLGIVEIRAPMPGKIVKVLVAEGAEVEANQGIVVMEAMKMQNEIKSPKKGVVRKLSAGEGMTVAGGDLLAIVE